MNNQVPSDKPEVETGVIHGRFQVLHNDHLKYLLAGKNRCRHLVVGLTNPDPTLTKQDPADPQRSNPPANPLNYFERYTMVRLALREVGIDEREFSIVPFPVNFPQLYKYYVPTRAVFFLTILDDWGRRKQKMFQALGLTTEVLWEKPAAQKGLCGAEIRRLMVAGEPWEQFVSESTARLMVKWNIPNRLRDLTADAAGPAKK